MPKSKMKNKKEIGVCKLTGEVGQFVKSHLIPLSFTRPEVNGEALFQIGSGLPRQRRRTSWYDATIVTRRGEDILAELDSYATDFLRRTRLVWSGWPMATRGAVLESDDRFRERNFRFVEIADPVRLRRFFLSLLWRAIVSARPEVADFEASPEVLENLRSGVFGSASLGDSEFPINLVQLTTLGYIHNFTPIVRNIPLNNDDSAETVRIYRFYLDGLVVWIRERTDAQLDRAGEYLSSTTKVLKVVTFPFEDSFQKRNMDQTIIDDALRNGPPSLRRR